MADAVRPHRPSFRDPANLELIGERVDPFARREAAHESAAALVHAGRASDDPEVTRRLLGLVDDLGLPTLADIWARTPARSLPGALYRLYVLREWMTRHPDEVARDYAAGVPWTEPHHAVAGIEPTGPDEVRLVADQILTGVFTGDVALAFDRAAAFCRVVVAGRTHMGAGMRSALDAARLLDTANDLAASARLWRAGRLE